MTLLGLPALIPVRNMFGQVLILISIFRNSLAIQPSAGCGKILPDSPKPGEHHRFFFERNDVLLGTIERDFIVQISKGKVQLF